MANSIITATGDGSTTQYPLNFTLGILNRDYVTCRVGSEVDGLGDPVYRTLEWITDGLVNVQGTVPGNGVPIVFKRTVPKDQLIHDYSDGVPIIESNLDESNLQTMMAIHEFLDGRLESGFVQDLNMNGFKITNLGDGTALTDAVNRGQLEDMTGNAPLYAAQAAASAAAALVSENNSQSSEDGAETAEAGAVAARLAAESARDTTIAAIDGLPYRDVVFLTVANSPFSVTNSHRGYMFVVDTSGGNVVINLPVIAPLTKPYVLGIKKSTSDVNTVTINRGGSDQIDVGQTSLILASVAGVNLVVDTDTTPDSWISASFGASAGETKNQVFVAGVGFTAGSSNSVTLSVTPIAPSSSSMLVFFDGIEQHPTEFSYTPGTGVIAFTETIPSFVKAIHVQWQSSTVAVGSPSDGTVSWLKLASGLIATVSDITNSIANKIVSAQSLATWVGLSVSLGTTQGHLRIFGVTLQWKKYTDSTGVSARVVALPTTFPTQCDAAFAICGSTFTNVICSIASTATSTVTVNTHNNNGTAVTSAIELHVFAIGR